MYWCDLIVFHEIGQFAFLSIRPGSSESVNGDNRRIHDRAQQPLGWNFLLDEAKPHQSSIAYERVSLACGNHSACRE